VTGKNPRFETYFAKERRWKAEFNALRAILLDCRLAEELKWRQPCYTYDGGNVVILSGYKASCVLGFFKGSLMQDPDKVLLQPGPNSRAARILRFTGLDDIKSRAKQIKRYVHDAIAVETSGRKVDFSANSIIGRPVELEAAFSHDAPFKAAFESLTTGRQRGWVMHFESAKQPATRMDRIAKARPKIMQGEGMHDGYRKRAIRSEL
jgi:uncharacterized protein YdeI (YjbR/CyaY-like superfamily)